MKAMGLIDKLARCGTLTGHVTLLPITLD